ncbi:MAG: hypothetical protein HGN29_08985 [Asgard group archaeon]|nr:hypothetical protein [Asgard group archaeon]
MAFGFEIIKDGIFKRTYTVYDLAQDIEVFQAEVIGMFRPEIIISEINGYEGLRCIKAKGWNERWSVEKNGISLFEFYSSGGICSGEYIIKLGSKIYRAPRSMSSFYEFHDDIGKIVFSFNRRTFSGNCIVEVREDFEPMVAISTAFILNFIFEQQVTAAGVVAAT